MPPQPICQKRKRAKLSRCVNPNCPRFPEILSRETFKNHFEKYQNTGKCPTMQREVGSYNNRACTNKACPEAGQPLSYYRLRQHAENFTRYGVCQLEADIMVPRKRDKKRRIKKGEGEGYICDIKGCPKAGMPLTQDMVKNHRKTFKRYGFCLK